METELRITKVTTYSIAKVVKLRPRHQSSTPVRRQLVYHDIDESTISGPRIPSMISLLSTDSLDNLDRVLANDLNPLQPKFEPKFEASITVCNFCNLQNSGNTHANFVGLNFTIKCRKKPMFYRTLELCRENESQKLRFRNWRKLQKLKNALRHLSKNH